MSEFDNSLDNATEVLEKDFNKYLEKGEQISESEKDTDEFSIQMGNVDFSRNSV